MMRDVFIIDGCRTPFIKSAGKPNPLSASDLSVACVKPLLEKFHSCAANIEEVIAGCAIPGFDEGNIGRIIALRLGLDYKVTGWTVQRNCASGLQSIDSGVKDIASGRCELILVGGCDAMSRTPLIYHTDMVNWLSQLYLLKDLRKKIIHSLKIRAHFFKPVIALLKGLTDPVVNLSMGQTAEKLAWDFNISREEMDTFAVQSHLRALKAVKEGYFKQEITTLYDWEGNYFTADNGVRENSSLEKLSKLKPVFDKPFGLVTAGNSSQITDGAAFLILASEQAVNKYNLAPLARIKDITWSGLSPSRMGLGPAHAVAALLKKNNLSLQDIDYWEINEAFATQVIACCRALNDPEYCHKNFGLSKPLGKINEDKLNIDGGAIAIGHPVGASGSRLVLHLMHILLRTNTLRGVASLCIGGGQGGALLLENIRGNFQ